MSKLPAINIKKSASVATKALVDADQTADKLWQTATTKLYAFIVDAMSDNKMWRELAAERGIKTEVREGAPQFTPYIKAVYGQFVPGGNKKTKDIWESTNPGNISRYAHVIGLAAKEKQTPASIAKWIMQDGNTFESRLKQAGNVIGSGGKDAEPLFNMFEFGRLLTNAGRLDDAQIKRTTITDAPDEETFEVSVKIKHIDIDGSVQIVDYPISADRLGSIRSSVRSAVNPLLAKEKHTKQPSLIDALGDAVTLCGLIPETSKGNIVNIRLSVNDGVATIYGSEEELPGPVFMVQHNEDSDSRDHPDNGDYYITLEQLSSIKIIIDMFGKTNSSIVTERKKLRIKVVAPAFDSIDDAIQAHNKKKKKPYLIPSTVAISKDQKSVYVQFCSAKEYVSAFKKKKKPKPVMFVATASADKSIEIDDDVIAHLKADPKIKTSIEAKRSLSIAQKFIKKEDPQMALSKHGVLYAASNKGVGWQFFEPASFGGNCPAIKKENIS